jgi:lysophospholipase L1-like esterase
MVEGEYRINSFGLRNKEFPVRKPSGVFRIICLGNSNTFGWKQPEPEAYPRQLQEWFDKSHPPRNIQVINAGITGYSSHQGRIFLETEISRLQPDLVLVNCGWNDLLPAKFGIPDKQQKLPPQWMLNIQDRLSETRLYQLLKSFWLAGFSRPEEIKKGIPRVSFEDFQGNLIEIGDFCRKNDIRVVFLTNPIASLEAFWGPGKISKTHVINQAYNQAIKDLAESHGFKVLDIAGLFFNRKDLYEDGKADFIHYNDQGHKLIARTIYEYLQRQEPVGSHSRIQRLGNQMSIFPIDSLEASPKLK